MKNLKTIRINEETYNKLFSMRSLECKSVNSVIERLLEEHEKDVCGVCKKCQYFEYTKGADENTLWGRTIADTLECHHPIFRTLNKTDAVYSKTLENKLSVCPLTNKHPDIKV